jgi:hypothetical protein
VKGFEPSASSLARKRSSQLSYTRIASDGYFVCNHREIVNLVERTY